MPKAADLLGSWKLESAWLLKGGAPSDEPAFDTVSGVLHYLPDGRMAVMIASQAFVAYAGTYSIAIDGEHVIHHLDISSSPSAVGADYVRKVRLDGERLELTTPTTIPEGRPMHLVWRRIPA